jgi:hypothetical protein
MSGVRQSLFPQDLDFWQKVQSLDLSPLAYQLMEANAGPRWSEGKTAKAIARYLGFLYLIDQYPYSQLVPSREIDEVWHHHILDTYKYAADCQLLFGRFIHHFPYLGTRGNADRHHLQHLFDMTQSLYQKHFGMIMTKDALDTEPESNPDRIVSASADCEVLTGVPPMLGCNALGCNALGCNALTYLPQQRPSVDPHVMDSLQHHLLRLAMATETAIAPN